ncbi:MAG: amylo-alpha-1,6-glucosidase [Ferruginibacter sp.]
MLQKDKTALQNYNEAIQYEWLETNGLGGWSSSTIIGCNTRRYHGLLIAATVPPAERMALVSKLDETIVIDDQRFELGTNNYGDAISPNGYNYLKSFFKDIFPQWIYDVNGVELKKTIAMIHGENTTLIIYDVIKAANPFSLELLPLLSVKGYHSMMRANSDINREASFDNNIFKVKAYEGTPGIFIKVPGGDYKANPNWFYHFNHSVEQYRGQDFIEDLFNHGIFSLQLKQGDSIGIIISIEDPIKKDAHELLSKESLRRQLLLVDQPEDKTLQQLILAADQFIVKRDEYLKTIIAGYHWFTDWGRDTMISLPGLCLSTGRFEDAKKIIAAFANSVSRGMLPNRFQDNGEAPEYNNVDGTLWYFIAVYKYLQASGDRDFILRDILPVLKEIVDWHCKGTRYNIHSTGDGLLYAGENGQQLTWMDARIGTWVVTPRMGKPVEIQALWYNAICIYRELLILNKEKDTSTVYTVMAERTKQSFNQLFWYEEGNYLYDNINENGISCTEIRPNQLFAISLPFTIIDDKKKAKAIIKNVEENLYTVVGLKSLAASDANYISKYSGDQWHRDSSYHQGTVWSWLLGAYVDAIMKTGGKNQKSKAKNVIEAFKYHLNEACIGSVSEIFDAGSPHHPRGCIAQAWGVAEILRVIKEYELFPGGRKSKASKSSLIGSI